MVYLVDTHCHLDLFKGIRSNVEEEDRLPIKTITVTNTPALWAPNDKLFKKCRNIRVALGLHPELADQREKETALFSDLYSETRYIGEIGLDGTSKERSVRDAQLRVFRHVLNMIKDSEPKILTVHSRGAAKETIDELTAILKGNQHQVILHWYSGGIGDLRRAVDLGFFFSVNHKMLASKNGIGIIKELNRTKILTETDAPFTFTDRIVTREESLNETLQGLGKEWRLSYDQAKQTVWENFKSVLHLAT